MKCFWVKRNSRSFKVGSLAELCLGREKGREAPLWVIPAKMKGKNFLVVARLRTRGNEGLNNRGSRANRMGDRGIYNKQLRKDLGQTVDRLVVATPPKQTSNHSLAEMTVGSMAINGMSSNRRLREVWGGKSVGGKRRTSKGLIKKKNRNAAVLVTAAYETELDG